MATVVYNAFGAAVLPAEDEVAPYIHTPASMMRLADFEATVRFVDAVVRRARTLFG